MTSSTIAIVRGSSIGMSSVILLVILTRRTIELASRIVSDRGRDAVVMIGRLLTLTDIVILIEVVTFLVQCILLSGCSIVVSNLISGLIGSGGVVSVMASVGVSVRGRMGRCWSRSHRER